MRPRDAVWRAVFQSEADCCLPPKVNLLLSHRIYKSQLRTNLPSDFPKAKSLTGLSVIIWELFREYYAWALLKGKPLLSISQEAAEQIKSFNLQSPAVIRHVHLFCLYDQRSRESFGFWERKSETKSLDSRTHLLHTVHVNMGCREYPSIYVLVLDGLRCVFPLSPSVLQLVGDFN